MAAASAAWAFGSLLPRALSMRTCVCPRAACARSSCASSSVACARLIARRRRSIAAARVKKERDERRSTSAAARQCSATKGWPPEMKSTARGSGGGEGGEGGDGGDGCDGSDGIDVDVVRRRRRIFATVCAATPSWYSLSRSNAMSAAAGTCARISCVRLCMSKSALGNSVRTRRCAGDRARCAISAARCSATWKPSRLSRSRRVSEGESKSPRRRWSAIEMGLADLADAI
mmetsp:Transcript_16388/g.35147  ORF Transcript_16388/g.35147 Transcript_16388/m.35147 type:complete len:231 (+) Transcript_16388:434-1126(+)